MQDIFVPQFVYYSPTLRSCIAIISLSTASCFSSALSGLQCVPCCQFIMNSSSFKRIIHEPVWDPSYTLCVSSSLVLFLNWVSALLQHYHNVEVPHQDFQVSYNLFPFHGIRPSCLYSVVKRSLLFWSWRGYIWTFPLGIEVMFSFWPLLNRCKFCL